MSTLDPRVGRWLLWLAPFAVLALAIGWQTDWGRALRREPPAEIAVAPAPVTTTVLPEFRIEGGVAASVTTVERPLFNAADLYEHTSRRPVASINFVTAHDGFTLRDLVSYNEKHNEANGDDNTDGESNNRSWNCGVEGPTDDPDIEMLRRRQQRNFLATTLLSQGVPMICHGDELGRTQGGNNNGYCQDNEITWVDWESADTELITFAGAVAAIRTAHPVLRRRRFFTGRPVRARGSQDVPDVAFFTPSGSEMTDEDWNTAFGKSVAVYLNGRGIPDLDERGQRVVDDSFVLCFNAHDEAIEFTLPSEQFGSRWQLLLDTASGLATVADEATPLAAEATVTVDGRALTVFRTVS